MDSIKQQYKNSSDLHMSSAFNTSYVMRPTSEWHEACLRGAKLGAIHANTLDVVRLA